MRFHGGADNMELLQMLMWIFTCKTMKLGQQVYQSRFQLKINIKFRILNAQRLIIHIRCSQFLKGPIVIVSHSKINRLSIRHRSTNRSRLNRIKRVNKIRCNVKFKPNSRSNSISSMNATTSPMNSMKCMKCSINFRIK